MRKSREIVINVKSARARFLFTPDMCRNMAMAFAGTEYFCLGCGDDISHRVHDRRNLTTTDAGKRVLKIWESFLVSKLKETDSYIEDISRFQLGQDHCYILNQKPIYYAILKTTFLKLIILLLSLLVIIIDIKFSVLL